MLMMLCVCMVDNGLIKEGWLKKKDSDGLIWHRRWVILTSDFLAIFKSQTSLNTPSAAIPLAGCVITRLKDNLTAWEITSPHITAKKGLGFGFLSV